MPGKNDRFFLDTNIFVYSFDRTAPAKSHRATDLIGQAIGGGKGIVSYQVVQEFFNVALRRFAQPLTPIEAEQYLRTVFSPLLSIHSSQALYVEALKLHAQHHLSWFDALSVGSAIQAQCDVLVTEDLQHGQRFGQLRIENPFL